MARQSKMFDLVTCTWNPVILYPCPHSCIYCYVNYIAKRYNLQDYLQSNGRPILKEERLHQNFPRNGLVFVCDMCDLFTWKVPDTYILKIFEIIHKHSRTRFLLLTKNPARYISLLETYGNEIFSQNMIFGATIETDNDELYQKHKISRALPPTQRLHHLKTFLSKIELDRKHAWISIEPIIDFTSPQTFAEKILTLLDHTDKLTVYVGYDNYDILKRHNIPEPSTEKTLELTDMLKQHGVEVRLKTIRKERQTILNYLQ